MQTEKKHTTKKATKTNCKTVELMGQNKTKHADKRRNGGKNGTECKKKGVTHVYYTARFKNKLDTIKSTLKGVTIMKHCLSVKACGR